MSQISETSLCDDWQIGVKSLGAQRMLVLRYNALHTCRNMTGGSLTCNEPDFKKAETEFCLYHVFLEKVGEMLKDQTFYCLSRIVTTWLGAKAGFHWTFH